MRPASGTNIAEIATSICEDIRARKLKAGDLYRNTAETARWLHVSGSTVNRALQLLAKRGVLQRRQRQGTIVLNAGQLPADAPLRRVHVLAPRDHLRTEGLWAETVLLGLQEALPGVDIQFNFRPEINEDIYVQDLLDEILRSREPSGLVLIRATVATQRAVAASGLPAVVAGALQPSVENLPSVDRDQAQIGCLLAESLLAARRRRIAIFMRERLSGGDHLMIDSALATLSDHQLPLSAITLRCLPTDAPAIEAAAVELLRSARRPMGFLCRSEALAAGVFAAVTRLKLRGKAAPAIVVADTSRNQTNELRFPCIQTESVAEQMGCAIGKALAALARGERPNPYRTLISIRLSTPKVD